MQLEDYDKDDGKMVWLDADEADLLMEKADRAIEKIALGLGLRCGLRHKYWVDVTRKDVYEMGDAYMLRYWDEKSEEYRETPMPEELYYRIDAYSDVMDGTDDDPLITVNQRQCRRWLKKAAGKCKEERADDRWEYLSTHDLRRSWANMLVNAGVQPGLVMDWGGWEKWDSFKDHYVGEYDPETQMREMRKVNWLLGDEHSGGPSNKRLQRKVNNI